MQNEDPAKRLTGAGMNFGLGSEAQTGQWAHTAW